MGVFIGLWVAQIVVSGLIFAFVPKRPDLPEKVNSNRDAAIKMGFVPCVGIMLFYQLAWIAWYFFAGSREDRKRSALQGQLITTGFETPSRPAVQAAPGGNPFADLPAPEPAPPASNGPAADNPFA